MKSLYFAYDPPGRTILSSTILNAKVAEVLVNTNEILKKPRNLILDKVSIFK